MLINHRGTRAGAAGTDCDDPCTGRDVSDVCVLDSYEGGHRQPPEEKYPGKAAFVVTTAESSCAVEVTDQVTPPPTVRLWYAAVDRLRAGWLRLGDRAEITAAGVLLVMAAAVFTLNAVL
jgi:hypothetical protein